jgi:membrane-anchored protein YejM (alkaline phosphatase superfamily)
MNELDSRRQRRQQLLRWWGALLLTTILLSLLLSTRYLAVAHFDLSPGALLFGVIMLIGHFSVLCFVLLLPVALIAWTWPRPRWVVATGALLSAAILLALLIDTQVYQLYRFHINAGVMNLLFGGAARETFLFPRVMYAQALLIAVAVIVIVATIAVLLWRHVQRTPLRPVLTRAIAGSVVASIVGFHALHAWADVLAYEPVLEQTTILPLPYAATAKRFLRARGVEVRAKPTFEMRADADRTGLSYPLRPLDCQAPVDPPNILFLLVDSWRFDELNGTVTPRIAEFAQYATRFTDHHSGGNATRIGVFSLFYAIPGTYWHQMLHERRGPVFIEELLRQGYDVEVFRSAPLYSPEFDRTVFANVDSPRIRSDGEGPAARDRDLTNDFLEFLETRRDATPFFALLFYDSPHSYDLPEDYPLAFLPSAAHVNYLRLSSQTDATPLLNRYRNSLHYVDGLVGEVLDRVQGLGLLQNTIVVITGDHGQEFNDNGRNYWGHGSNYTRYQTGVPLLLYVPGAAGSRVVSHRTTHFDIAPTLLREHLGCAAAFRTYSVGRLLTEPGGRDTLVLSEYADFAIVQRDRIAVVREQGMQIFGPDYAELDVALDPAAARAALEQKVRFHKPLRKADAASTKSGS